MLSNGFENKVALITGASRGIGLEMARELLRQKAKVVICARKQEGLDNAVADLQGGENLLAVTAHVAKEEDVDSLFEQIKENYGKLDVLINNAGMNIMTSSMSDVEFSLWQKILDSNLNGAFLCASRAARMMKEQQEGKIVNISSLAARKATPGMGVYGVAKAGIEMLTKVLAAELAADNIQVNAVAPCMVKTDFSKPFWSDPSIHDNIVNNIPAGCLAEPSDIVKAVLFLTSNDSDFITGETLVVDGGSSAI